MDTTLRDQILRIAESEPVFLWMNGTPVFPQCHSSNEVVQILKAYDVPYGHYNVLEDVDVQQGVKELANCPTIPLLFIRGEFVGSIEVVREAWESGELTTWLREAYPGRKIEASPVLAEPQPITPEQARSMMEGGGVRLLDVRTAAERENARVEGSVLLDQELSQEILDHWDKETPMIFMCHFGERSAQACGVFAEKGFQKIFHVEGGIDAWSQSVDPSIPRY